MKIESENSAVFNLGLAGQPNTGKSSLFNVLTGGRQHVGNWPGKTIERKSGLYSHNDKRVEIVDLPGTYSLRANSTEELISRNHIVSDETDALIVMIDASQLQRSMYLLAEITGIGVPVILACTMMDIAQGQGKSIDIEKLEHNLGVPVAAINAATGKGIEALKDRILSLKLKPAHISKTPLHNKYLDIVGNVFDRLIRRLPQNGIGKYSASWLAVRLIERDHEIIELVRASCDDETFTQINTTLEEVKDGPLSVANARYAWIEEILYGVVIKNTPDHLLTIKGFDRMAIHWFWGKIMSVLIILLGITVSMLLVSPIMAFYYYGLPPLMEFINQALTASALPLLLQSFLADAVIPGMVIAAMISLCIPIWILVFAVLENIGYISRVAYVFNAWMESLGLNGKSILPFISGFLCNIMGVAGSRVIDSHAQRKTTIATSLAVPCLGAWAVILLMAPIFFGIQAIWIVFALFFTMLVHISFTAWLFRDKSINRADAPGLIMELPPYHKPNWSTIFQILLRKTKSVAARAGTIIIVATLLIWAFTFSGTGEIANSILYRFGKAVEPVSMLIGFDWRLLTAIIFSAFAKEASIGVIAILFGAGEAGTSLSSAMVSPGIFDQAALTSAIGAGVSKASALAFIFAFYFNVPCLPTVAFIRSETLSVSFSLLVAGYYFLGALVIAAVTYRIGLMIF